MRACALVTVTMLASQPLAAQSWAAGGEWANQVGFSTSLAVQGSEIYVGRQGSPFTPAGAVHVFRRAGGAWEEAAPVQARGVRPGDLFGSSMAVSGNLMAVGAPRHGEAGAVFLFARRGGAWEEVARLAVPGGGEDRFGAAVALAGDLLVVGAPGRDSARGEVFAFRRGAEGTWSAAERVGAGAAATDGFGTAVSAAAGRVLVGVPGPFPGRLRMGRAALYRHDGRGWVGEADFVPAVTDSALAYGASVLLAGDRVWIGSPIALRGAGAVFGFRQTAAGGWEPEGRLVAEDRRPQSRFGSALAWAAGQLLVGAPGSFSTPAVVYMLASVDGTWRVGQRIEAGAGLGGNAQFGATLAADELVAVVGAPNADFGEGTGTVLVRDGVDGPWRAAGPIVHAPLALPAVTGDMVRCDSTAGRAGGFTCGDVDLLSFLPLPAIGGRRGIQLNDIWGWTDPETGREYALVGRMDGTSFVDITDPVHPVYLGDLPLTAGARPNTWRDIKTYRNHAFIVADGAGPHGMQVFDLTRLRQVSEAPATFTPDAVYDRIASAHNIAINEETGYAYTIGNSGGGETCGGALHMIDIREPRNPKFAGCFADPSTGNQRTGYTHDNQCVVYRGPDARYQGREICFNASETAVGIADVTDKANPRAIAVASYPNTAYAHQGWLTEDHRYFFLNDEGDETSGKVERTRTLGWDVTKLDEPVLVTEFLGTTGASDHNLYIRGRYMYQANYTAGLRVIDIQNPLQPKEVAYFDTVPWGENAPGFDGAWSVYPFFRSGTIVVSSQREGLFVVRHRKMEMVP